MLSSYAGLVVDELNIYIFHKTIISYLMNSEFLLLGATNVHV